MSNGSMLGHHYHQPGGHNCHCNFNTLQAIKGKPLKKRIVPLNRVGMIPKYCYNIEELTLFGRAPQIITKIIQKRKAYMSQEPPQVWAGSSFAMRPFREHFKGTTDLFLTPQSPTSIMTGETVLGNDKKTTFHSQTGNAWSLIELLFIFLSVGHYYQTPSITI